MRLAARLLCGCEAALIWLLPVACVLVLARLPACVRVVVRLCCRRTPVTLETTVKEHQRLEHLPSIPAGDSEEVWAEARAILRGFCSYGSEKMSAASLLMASHTPPADWDGSPWWCDHCNQYVYQDPDHYLEVVMEQRCLAAACSSWQ